MAKIDKKTQENLAQLQLLQQRLQVFASQKQQFQLQLIEIDNALQELKTAKEPVYVSVGGILIEKKKVKVKKDLESKKAEINIKVKNFESQENKIKKQAKELQEALTKKLK